LFFLVYSMSLQFLILQRLRYSGQPAGFSSGSSRPFPRSRMSRSARGVAGLVDTSGDSSKAYVWLNVDEGSGGEGLISDWNI